VVIGIFLAGFLLQGYGAFVTVWQAEFGWSKTALAAAFSLQRVQAAVLAPLQGWLLERYGPRLVMQVGIVLWGVGFILLSRVSTLTGFYVFILLLALGASLAGFMTLSAVIVNWFRRYRSTALALTQVGWSIGGFVVPLLAWSLTAWGWRSTSAICGLIILIAGLPITLLMRTRPEDYGLVPDGVSEDPQTGKGEGQTSSHFVPEPVFTPAQALRTRAFWLLSSGHALAGAFVSGIFVHLVVHLTEGMNVSLQAAASVIALMTGCMMLGQLIGGLLGDRYSKRLLASLAMVAHAAALSVLVFAGSLALVIAFAVIHGVALGVRGPLMSAMRADYFGRTSFARIMGFSTIILMMGQMSGPLLAGVLADVYGSYRPAFAVLAVVALLGVGCFAFANRPRAPYQ
jgi:MFS family permease